MCNLLSGAAEVHKGHIHEVGSVAHGHGLLLQGPLGPDEHHVPDFWILEQNIFVTYLLGTNIM